MEREDGSGTITIGPKPLRSDFTDGIEWWPGLKLQAAIRHIQDVRNVHNKIIELQRASAENADR